MLKFTWWSNKKRGQAVFGSMLYVKHMSWLVQVRMRVESGIVVTVVVTGSDYNYINITMKLSNSYSVL